MKKLFILILIISFGIFASACSSSLESLVENNMSDIRMNFFTGENEEFYVNLSCGYREEIFAYDGVCTNKVECGVITLGFKEAKNYSLVSVILKINEIEQEVVLNKSPYEDVYMADIQKLVENNISISVKLKNQNNEVVLNEESHLWQIDYKEALNIATNHFKQELENLYFNNKLNAECYLKILTKKDFEKIYWFFSFVDRSDNFINCLIDVTTGEILTPSLNQSN